jgi:hypothetical protein
MANASVLAARFGARVFRRAIADGSRACKNAVTSIAKPVLEKGSQGWGLPFGLPLRPFRPIKLSRNK